MDTNKVGVLRGASPQAYIVHHGQQHWQCSGAHPEQNTYKLCCTSTTLYTTPPSSSLLLQCLLLRLLLRLLLAGSAAILGHWQHTIS